jgi:hypothetical protein
MREIRNVKDYDDLIQETLVKKAEDEDKINAV